MIDRTIDIPRIIVIPNGEVRSGFHPFTLNLNSINYPVPSTDLWIQRSYSRSNASAYNQSNGGKPWCYTLIPHDEIKENMTLKGLSARFISK